MYTPQFTRCGTLPDPRWPIFGNLATWSHDVRLPLQ